MKRVWIIIFICLCLCGCTSGTKQQPVLPVTEQTDEPTQAVETTQSANAGLHSGLNPDGSFDGTTLFIGDSLTYGMVVHYLPDNGFLGDAKYMAIPGAAITCYKKGPALGAKPSAYSPEFEGMYMYSAVEEYGADMTAVYLMLGTNANEYATDEVYLDMVTHILEHCPKATVYLELVPNDKSYKVSSEKANDRILRIYEQLSGEQRLRLIDTCTAIGYHLAGDGIHLTKSGQKLWYEALVDYAAENEIGR